MRVRRATEAAAVLHPPASAIGLIVRVGLELDPVLFLQAPLGVLETFATRAGNRAFLLGASLLQALLGCAASRAGLGRSRTPPVAHRRAARRNAHPQRDRRRRPRPRPQ